MNFTDLLLPLIVASLLFPPANPAPTPTCVSTIVALSPCLPHVAAFPDPPRPSAACCAAFSASALTGDGREGAAGCVCYLVKDEMMLGFPVNATRVVGLFGFCGDLLEGDRDVVRAFRKLCGVPNALSPLGHTTGTRNCSGGSNGSSSSVDGSGDGVSAQASGSTSDVHNASAPSPIISNIRPPTSSKSSAELFFSWIAFLICGILLHSVLTMQ